MTREPHQLGDAPIEPEYIKKMNDVARTLDRTFNGEARGNDREVGFVLLVISLWREGRACKFYFEWCRPERYCHAIQGNDREVRRTARNEGARIVTNSFVEALERAQAEIERLHALTQNNAHSWDAIVRERDKLLAENAQMRALLSEALADPEITLQQPWWDKVRAALESMP